MTVDVHIWLQQYSRLNFARSGDPDELKIELRTLYGTIEKLDDIDVSLNPADGINQTPVIKDYFKYKCLFTSRSGASPKRRTLRILAKVKNREGEHINLQRSYPILI